MSSSDAIQPSPCPLSSPDLEAKPKKKKKADKTSEREDQGAAEVNSDKGTERIPEEAHKPATGNWNPEEQTEDDIKANVHRTRENENHKWKNEKVKAREESGEEHENSKKKRGSEEWKELDPKTEAELCRCREESNILMCFKSACRLKVVKSASSATVTDRACANPALNRGERCSASESWTDDDDVVPPRRQMSACVKDCPVYCEEKTVPRGSDKHSDSRVNPAVSTDVTTLIVSDLCPTRTQPLETKCHVITSNSKYSPAYCEEKTVPGGSDKPPRGKPAVPTDLSTVITSDVCPVRTKPVETNCHVIASNPDLTSAVPIPSATHTQATPAEKGRLRSETQSFFQTSILTPSVIVSPSRKGEEACPTVPRSSVSAENVPKAKQLILSSALIESQPLVQEDLVLENCCDHITLPVQSHCLDSLNNRVFQKEVSMNNSKSFQTQSSRQSSRVNCEENSLTKEAAVGKKIPDDSESKGDITAIDIGLKMTVPGTKGNSLLASCDYVRAKESCTKDSGQNSIGQDGKRFSRITLLPLRDKHVTPALQNTDDGGMSSSEKTYSSSVNNKMVLETPTEEASFSKTSNDKIASTESGQNSIYQHSKFLSKVLFPLEAKAKTDDLKSERSDSVKSKHPMPVGCVGLETGRTAYGVFGSDDDKIWSGETKLFGGLEVGPRAASPSSWRKRRSCSQLADSSYLCSRSSTPTQDESTSLPQFTEHLATSRGRDGENEPWMPETKHRDQEESEDSQLTGCQEKSCLITPISSVNSGSQHRNEDAEVRSRDAAVLVTNICASEYQNHLPHNQPNLTSSQTCETSTEQSVVVKTINGVDNLKPESHSESQCGCGTFCEHLKPTAVSIPFEVSRTNSTIFNVGSDASSRKHPNPRPADSIGKVLPEGAEVSILPTEHVRDSNTAQSPGSFSSRDVENAISTTCASEAKTAVGVTDVPLSVSEPGAAGMHVAAPSVETITPHTAPVDDAPNDVATLTSTCDVTHSSDVTQVGDVAAGLSAQLAALLREKENMMEEFRKRASELERTVQSLRVELQTKGKKQEPLP